MFYFFCIIFNNNCFLSVTTSKGKYGQRTERDGSLFSRDFYRGSQSLAKWGLFFLSGRRPVHQLFLIWETGNLFLAANLIHYSQWKILPVFLIVFLVLEYLVL